MKKTVATLVLLTALLAACGADTAKNIDGPWLGQLFYPDATPAANFSATLKQESGSAVDVSGFVLDGPSCFSPPLTSSAMFSATGSSGGFVIGTFTMTVSTAFPGREQCTYSERNAHLWSFRRSGNYESNPRQHFRYLGDDGPNGMHRPWNSHHEALSIYVGPDVHHSLSRRKSSKNEG